jgi:hypothetical protein
MWFNRLRMMPGKKDPRCGLNYSQAGSPRGPPLQYVRALFASSVCRLSEGGGLL